MRLAGPVPIFVPPLRDRASELSRIVEAYAVDAVETIAALAAPVRAQDSCFFTGDDLQWVLECMATSLPEIEKGHLANRGAPDVGEPQHCC